MKTLPRIMSALALSSAAIVVPAGAAQAMSPTPTVTASCTRATANGATPAAQVISRDIALDINQDATVVVTLDDGTTLTSVQAAGNDRLQTFVSPLGANQTPVSVSVTQGAETVTTTIAGTTNCEAPVAAPVITQNIVAGPNNDTWTLTEPDGTVLTQADVPWANGTASVSFNVQGWAPAPHWFSVNGVVGNAPSYTLTDDGGAPTRQVAEIGTVTVPVYSTRSTCTDPVVGTFQVDSYRPATPAQVNTLRANSARNTLPYRYDGPNAPQLAKVYRAGSYASLWDRSTVEFVTIKRSDVTRAGSLAAAINARTTKVPNLGGSLAVGRTWTTAWKLAPGATVKAPWTATPTTAAAKAQTEYDRVGLPAASCTTVRVQTGTRTVTGPTGRTTTVARGPLQVPATSVDYLVFG